MSNNQILSHLCALVPSLPARTATTGGAALPLTRRTFPLLLALPTGLSRLMLLLLLLSVLLIHGVQIHRGSQFGDRSGVNRVGDIRFGIVGVDGGFAGCGVAGAGGGAAAVVHIRGGGRIAQLEQR